MEVRAASIADLETLVTIHKTNLDGDLVALGERVLRDFYYNGLRRGVLNAYFIQENETPVGLAVLTPKEKAVFHRCLASSANDAIRLLINAQKLPLLRIFFQVLWRTNRSAETSHYLLYFAIDNCFRRKGYGRRLLNKVERHLCEAGAHSYHLRVNRQNICAINFYERNGFQVNIHTYENKSVVMRKTVDPSAS